MSRQREDIANVLIADEDPELARLLLEIFARKGIRGHLVHNKEDALEFINNDSCDFVFINDILRPHKGMAGRLQDSFELLGTIKANQPELPVVMMTKLTEGSIENKQHVVETEGHL